MKIDLEKAKKEFKNYVSKYDLNNPNIQRKIKHSYRVAEKSKKIAQEMKLQDEEIKLAELIGLLHDIGRFEQEKRYKNYDVISKFDHGDYAAELLEKEIRNYIETDKYDNIIIKAVKNHNKYEIEKGLNEKEEFFAKLIRDADKLDILYEETEIFWIGEEEQVNRDVLSEEIYRKFFECKTIEREKDKVYGKVDDIVMVLAFIYDINFKETYKLIKENEYINKTIKRFSFKDKQTYEKVKEIVNISNKYIEQKIQ